MSQNKTDILLFLLYIGILIFAEKITDHHHAYNRRSEITHMTCNGTAKVWRSASKNLNIFTCRILKTLRSIVTQKKLYLVYEAEWNYVKMNRDGKCKSLLYYFFLPQLLILTIGSKFLNPREVLFRE